MLSQKILNTVKFSRNKILKPLSILQLSTSSALMNRSVNEWNVEEEEKKKPVRELKQWRESVIDKHNDKGPIIKVDPKSSFFEIFKTNMEFTPWGIAKYYREKMRESNREMQKFVPMRHKILGPDLAFAHFITFLGGKVKFKGQDKWISLNEDQKSVNLPDRYDANYILVEVDASDVELYYEALENCYNVTRVKRLIFARSPLLDDWFVDKISTLFPVLEYLDISECPKVSERGLEALYRAGNLKTLIITNHLKSASFELTCLLLEDCLPDLKIKILEPKEEGNKKEN